MRLGQQSIRRLLLRRLLKEAEQIRRGLRKAHAAFEVGRHKDYVTRCLDVEADAILLAMQTSWLVGTIAIHREPVNSLLRSRDRARFTRTGHRPLRCNR